MSQDIVREDLLSTHFRGQQVACRSLVEAATLRRAENFLSGRGRRDARRAIALAAALERIGQHEGARQLRAAAVELRGTSRRAQS